VTDRPDWIERMSETERARHFRHYTPEQFRWWIAERVARGIPDKCEDVSTLARVGLLVAKGGKVTADAG
jgi:hypothetical protein